MRFFCEEIYQKWQRCVENANAGIRSGIKVDIHVKKAVEVLCDDKLSTSGLGKGKRDRDASGGCSIEDIHVGYTNMKGLIEKSTSLLAAGEITDCSVCSEAIGIRRELALVCPGDSCNAMFHMSCLGARFLTDEGASDSVVPTAGKCPRCKLEVRWIDLIKEMSLRIRGKREVALLLKKTRERKVKAIISQAEVSDSEDVTHTDTDAGIHADANLAADSDDDALPDDWDDDVKSVMSAASGLSEYMEMAGTCKPSLAAPKLKAVIEDSECDDAEVTI